MHVLLDSAGIVQRHIDKDLHERGRLQARGGPLQCLSAALAQVPPGIKPTQRVSSASVHAILGGSARLSCRFVTHTDTWGVDLSTLTRQAPVKSRHYDSVVSLQGCIAHAL